MNSNPTLFLIVGIIGLIGFGILFFVGLNMWREERAGKRDDYKFGEAKPAAASAPPAAPAGTHEVLRVLRDDLSGRLIVEIAGKRYSKIAEIADPNIGRGFLTTLRDLQRFTQGQATGASPAETPLSAAAQSKTEAPPPTPAAAPPLVKSPPSIEVPSMNPFKQMQVLRERAKTPAPQPKSITEQIDEVLQAKLEGTRHSRRGIKVHTGPTGSALFDLDGKSYEGVDAVPDPEVQGIIRAAVKEWESRQ